MVHRRSALFLAAVVVLALVATGCAKRPSGLQASAPPPAGEARVTSPDASKSGTAATASTAGGPRTGDPGARGPDSGRGPGSDRPVIRDFVAVPELKDIHFDFDKYDIRPVDTEILDENAKWLRAHGDHFVLIEGHADERGTNEYNMALGERRAKAAMDYLVSRGIQRGRFTVVSLGEERPACVERTQACWARNRRAHFLVKPR